MATLPEAFCRPVFDPGGPKFSSKCRCKFQLSVLPPQTYPSTFAVREDAHPNSRLNSGPFEHPLQHVSEKCVVEQIDFQCISDEGIQSGEEDALLVDLHLSTLLKNKHLDQVLEVLLHGYKYGVFPDLHIYWSFLKLCKERADALLVKQLHARIVFLGFDFISSLSDYLLSTLFKCGGFELGVRIFHMVPYRTVHTWKVLISAFVDDGLYAEAITLYEIMQEEGLEPDKYIFVSLTKACGSIGDLDQGRLIHADVREIFLHVDVLVGTALVVMYGKCGEVAEAENVFNSLMEHDVVSWNAMLSMYNDQDQAQKALQLYRQMLEEGPRPDCRTHVIVTSACSIFGDREETVMMGRAIGQALHAGFRRLGFDSSNVLCNSLLKMHGKCKEFVCAQKVFDEMSTRDVVAWTTMLKVCNENGEEQTALKLYRQMHIEDVCPDERTFVAALQACCLLAKKQELVAVEGQMINPISLIIGRALHSDAQNMSFELDVFTCSTLIVMYGACKQFVEAEHVFAKLSCCNHVAFNAMISVYIDKGEGDKALLLYRQMQEEGVQCDERTFASALQACRMLAEMEFPVLMEGRYVKLVSLEIGRALHSDVRNTGFGSDVLVCYSLVSMYKQCGAILEAVDLFKGTSAARSGMMWAEILSSYVEEGEGEKALRLFKCMQDEGFAPNKWTFMIAIQACCAIAEKEGILVNGESAMVVSLRIGQALHCDARKKSLDSDSFVGSTLLTFYGMCGDIDGAENVFNGLSEHDIASWNAILYVYLEQGDGEKTLKVYRDLVLGSVCPNEVTYVAALQACCLLTEKEGAVLESQLTPLEIGRAVHADVCREVLDSIPFVCSALVNMYGQCKSIREAENAFSREVEHDVVSWTALMVAYLKSNEVEMALQIYRHMQEEGMVPDPKTFVYALEACATFAEREEAMALNGKEVKVKSLEMGRALHANSISLGCSSDAFVQGNLVDVYSKSGVLDNAETTFNASSQQHIVQWNAILCAYVDHGQEEKALHLYGLLVEVDVFLTELTLLCVLRACALTANTELCRQVHFLVECVGYNTHTNLQNALTSAYASCACMADSQSTFDGISRPDIVSWNALITGYGQQGDHVTSFWTYDRMRQAGIALERVTGLSLVSICSHAGAVDEGFHHFELMMEDHGLVAHTQHCIGLLDLLGRAGDFAKVEMLLSRVPQVQPMAPVWLNVLGASQSHGNMEVSKWAFAWAVYMQPEQAKAYVMMSNLHASMASQLVRT